MSQGSPQQQAIQLNAGLAADVKPGSAPVTYQNQDGTTSTFTAQQDADARALRDNYQIQRQNTPEGRLQMNAERAASLNESLSANAGNEYLNPKGKDGPETLAKRAELAGLTAQNAQIQAGITSKQGLEAHKIAAETALQGHKVTAQERAVAIKEAAMSAGLSRVEAAKITAEGRKDTAEQNRIAREGLTSKEELQQKRDISTRLREGQRAHQAALKTGDQNQIAAAVDYLDQLNADAKTYGVAAIPLPARPMTTEETTKATVDVTPAATEAAKGKRGFVRKLFGMNPSKTAIDAEVKKLLPAANGLGAGIPQPVQAPAKPQAAPMFAKNASGVRIVSHDGGMSWVPAQ
jgi:hypothetical protein